MREAKAVAFIDLEPVQWAQGASQTFRRALPPIGIWGVSSSFIFADMFIRDTMAKFLTEESQTYKEMEEYIIHPILGVRSGQ